MHPYPRSAIGPAPQYPMRLLEQQLSALIPDNNHNPDLSAIDYYGVIEIEANIDKVPNPRIDEIIELSFQLVQEKEIIIKKKWRLNLMVFKDLTQLTKERTGLSLEDLSKGLTLQTILKEIDEKIRRLPLDKNRSNFVFVTMFESTINAYIAKHLDFHDQEMPPMFEQFICLADCLPKDLRDKSQLDILESLQIKHEIPQYIRSDQAATYTSLILINLLENDRVLKLKKLSEPSEDGMDRIRSQRPTRVIKPAKQIEDQSLSQINISQLKDNSEIFAERKYGLGTNISIINQEKRRILQEQTNKLKEKYRRKPAIDKSSQSYNIQSRDQRSMRSDSSSFLHFINQSQQDSFTYRGRRPNSTQSSYQSDQNRTHQSQSIQYIENDHNQRYKFDRYGIANGQRQYSSNRQDRSRSNQGVQLDYLVLVALTYRGYTQNSYELKIQEVAVLIYDLRANRYGNRVDLFLQQENYQHGSNRFYSYKNLQFRHQGEIVQLLDEFLQQEQLNPNNSLMVLQTKYDSLALKALIVDNFESNRQIPKLILEFVQYIGFFSKVYLNYQRVNFTDIALSLRIQIQKGDNSIGRVFNLAKVLNKVRQRYGTYPTRADINFIVLRRDQQNSYRPSDYYQRGGSQQRVRSNFNY